MLHIVKHSRLLPEVVTYATPGDVILLIEDAVYAVNPLHKDHRFIQQSSHTYYYLQPDVQARGLSPDTEDNRLSGADYQGFVRLVVEHPTSITWET